MSPSSAQLSVLLVFSLASAGDAKPFFDGLSRGWLSAEPLVREEPYANEIWTPSSAEDVREISPEVATANDLNGKQTSDIFEEPIEKDRSKARQEGRSEVVPGTATDVEGAHQADVTIDKSASADVKPLEEPPLDFTEELEAAELDLIMKRMHAMCDGLATKPAHLRHGLVADLCRSICDD